MGHIAQNSTSTKIQFRIELNLYSLIFAPINSLDIKIKKLDETHGAKLDMI